MPESLNTLAYPYSSGFLVVVVVGAKFD